MFSSFGVNSIHEYFVLIFSSTMNQSAILSDIHANIWALEAVLDDISRRGPAQLINLGDSLYGPLEPQATAAYLMQLPLSASWATRIEYSWRNPFLRFLLVWRTF